MFYNFVFRSYLRCLTGNGIEIRFMNFLPKKNWKTSEKLFFLAKKKTFFSHFQWDFEDTFWIQNCRSFIFHYYAIFRFLNFPVVFDLEPKNYFLVYLAKTNILAKRAGWMLQGFDKSQYMGWNYMWLNFGPASSSGSWEISVWKASRSAGSGRASSRTNCRLLCL